MADVELGARDRITGPMGFHRSSVADQWRHRCVDHNVVEYPDGRIEIRANGTALACRQYDRLSDMDQGGGGR
jgi:hypothetical protein